MAICRCKQHPPKGRTKTYVSISNPVGFPDTAVICGNKKCQRPGLIWLTQVEENAYQKGTRIFELDSRTAKVKADDSGTHKI